MYCEEVRRGTDLRAVPTSPKTGLKQSVAQDAHAQHGATASRRDAASLSGFRSGC
jgi:hypothetical protein